MQASQRVAKNTLILYAKTGITMFLSLYTTRVVLRELGASDFGIFALIGSAISIFAFLNGSMAAATQRFMSYAHGKQAMSEQKAIFNISFVLHIFAGFLLITILAAIGPLLFDNLFQIEAARYSTAKLVYYFVVGGSLFTVISVPYTAVIIARENMLFMAITGFIESVLKFSIAIILSHSSGNKLMLYGILMAGVPIILMLVQAIYCHSRYRECRFSRKGIQNPDLRKEMVAFAGWSFLGSFSAVLTRNGQGLVLNAFFGTIVNAAQGISNQVSGQLGVFAGLLEKVISPVVTKKEGSGDRQSMLRIAMTGSKVVFLLRAILFVPVIIEMPYIFSIWLIETPPFTVIFCRIYLMTNIVEGFIQSLHLTISSVGKIKSYQIVYSLITPIPIVVSIFLFILGLSPEVLYIAFFMTAFLLLLTQLYFSNRLCSLNVKEYTFDVLLRCTATLLITFFAGVIPFMSIETVLLRIFLVFLISIMTMTAAFFLLTLNSREKLLIVKLCKAIFKKVFGSLSSQIQ